MSESTGGKWTEKWSESDNTHDNWGRSNDHRADDFTSKTGDGGNHCHLWIDKDSGERGVEHRGNCKVCDDERESEKGSGGK